MLVLSASAMLVGASAAVVGAVSLLVVAAVLVRRRQHAALNASYTPVRYGHPCNMAATCGRALYVVHAGATRPPVQYGHPCDMLTRATWLTVQYGRLWPRPLHHACRCNTATCAIRSAVQYGRPRSRPIASCMPVRDRNENCRCHALIDFRSLYGDCTVLLMAQWPGCAVTVHCLRLYASPYAGHVGGGVGVAQPCRCHERSGKCIDRALCAVRCAPCRAPWAIGNGL